jgi:PAS domain S-box-containing protein
MFAVNEWQPHFTITLIALYAGAFLAQEILKRKSEFYSEIQKQEKRYVALVENMNDGLLFIDKNDTIIFVNDKFCNISGYDREDILEKQNDFFSSYITNTGASTFYRKLKKGESFRSEIRMRRKNGELVWIQVNAAPHYEEGQIAGSMIVHTDITALKSTQRELKKKEEGYRTFINQSAIGIWRAEYLNPISVTLPVEEQIDLLLDTGIISECNDFMAGMYGFASASELIGRRIRDFYYYENNMDEETARNLMHTFISNNYRTSNSETKELDKDGNARFILNNNIGIVENGYLVRTWGVQNDITERKKTEKALLETNHELDTFFYKASHDLKGPLASVMGIVNLALLENQDPHIEKYFGMIETSIHRLDRTLMDLVELARTRKGSSKLSEINLRELVDEILYSYRNLPNFERIKFEINIDPEADIVSDRVLMLSVFQNLIQNAINYCNRKNPWIRIRIASSGNGIELEIADNGQGIPEKIRNKVFEMFYRGNPDSAGSGLGLFIVKNALEKLRGKISFVSKEGQGTTFTVYIPSAAVFA